MRAEGHSKWGDEAGAAPRGVQARCVLRAPASALPEQMQHPSTPAPPHSQIVRLLVQQAEPSTEQMGSSQGSGSGAATASGSGAATQGSSEQYELPGEQVWPPPLPAKSEQPSL